MRCLVEKLPMKKTVGATEARNNLGKLLNRVNRREEHVVVEKMGIPAAVMISIQDYEHYQRLLAAEMLQDLGRRIGAEAERQGLTEDQLIEEMEEDREAVYQEMFG